MNRLTISTLIYLSLAFILINASIAREKDQYNYISLHQAITNGDVEEVKTILSSGLDINVRNSLQRTSLHTAIEKQQKEIVQLLLDRGADVDPIDNKGQTPFHLAVITGQKDIVELLISRRADINIVDTQYDNALTLAKKGNHAEDLQEILYSGLRSDL